MARYNTKDLSSALSMPVKVFAFIIDPCPIISYECVIRIHTNQSWLMRPLHSNVFGGKAASLSCVMVIKINENVDLSCYFWNADF